MSTRLRLVSLKLQQERDLEIARLEEELANRPAEPPVDATISFEKRWLNGSYSYVAYQAIEGWWYLSQSNFKGRGFNRMKWDELLDFIDGSDIFIVTEWEQL